MNWHSRFQSQRVGRNHTRPHFFIFKVVRQIVGKRDLLFIGMCFCGMVAVAGSLLDQGPLQHSTSVVISSQPQLSNFLETVAQVDKAFSNDWSQAGLQSTTRASDLLIARRLSLALTGSIPSFEEIRTLQRLPEERRVTDWVDRLLSDRRYADYLAERLARAYVGTEEGPFLVYRRRRFVKWLSSQLADNRPYDQLVRDLITVEGLWTDSPAANFLTVTIDQNGDKQPDETRLAGRITRAFLGIRIDCLQCHDDKLDQIVLGDSSQQRTGLQSDFHQLAAYFGSVQNSLTGIQDKPAQKYRFKYLDEEQERLSNQPFHSIPSYLVNRNPGEPSWLTG